MIIIINNDGADDDDNSYYTYSDDDYNRLSILDLYPYCIYSMSFMYIILFICIHNIVYFITQKGTMWHPNKPRPENGLGWRVNITSSQYFETFSLS